MKPRDIVFECDGDGNDGDIDTWLASNGGGMATDDCDTDVTWTVVAGALVIDCGNSFTQEYTF